MHLRHATAAPLAFLILATGLAAAGEGPIAILAGPKDDEGPDAHAYPQEAAILRAGLEANGAAVRVVEGGWPADDATAARLLDGAAALILISSGTYKSHPFYVDGKGRARTQPRIDLLARHVERGMGLVVTHAGLDIGRYPVEGARKGEPNPHAERLRGWLGTAFIGDPPHTGLTNAATPLAVEHPALRGVRPWTLREEYYYMDPAAVAGDARMTPLLGARASFARKGEAAAERDWLIAWATARADGGRSFCFTGPHFLATYRDADVQRFVLNGVLWAAQREVPAGGAIVSVR